MTLPNKLIKARIILFSMIIAASAIMPEAARAKKDAPAAHAHAGYLAAGAAYVQLDNSLQLDDGVAANISVGYRKDIYAIELGVILGEHSGTSTTGLLINGLIFPFNGIQNLYLVLAGGATEIDSLPALRNAADAPPLEQQRRTHVSFTSIEGGVGYLFPLSIGSFGFDIRADARYRYANRSKELNERDEDFPIDRNFQDYIVQIGIQIPF